MKPPCLDYDNPRNRKKTSQTALTPPCDCIFPSHHSCSGSGGMRTGKSTFSWAVQTAESQNVAERPSCSQLIHNPLFTLAFALARSSIVSELA